MAVKDDGDASLTPRSPSSDTVERSLVWKLFTRESPTTVKCLGSTLGDQPCCATFKYASGGPTTTMWRHLRKCHPIALHGPGLGVLPTLARKFLSALDRAGMPLYPGGCFFGVFLF